MSLGQRETAMTGRIAALFQYPIKGFTPQKVDSAALVAGQAFPGDRLFAVEDGPSGFDPRDPSFIPKQRFAVLAKMAEVAKARTHYDLDSGRLTASAAGVAPLEVTLEDEDGRNAFCEWLGVVLGETPNGALRVLDGVGHRFLDDPRGHVSIINLASVREISERVGRALDPLRFRANLYVEDWPAWSENAWAGREMRLGAAEARVLAPITRCAAPSVDPTTAVRDVDVVAEIHRWFGHLLCGIYVQVTRSGVIANNDCAELV
jgi:uncharacterized protein YcbX